MDAAEIARALGGKPRGNYWMCKCPAHDDRKPSLLIKQGFKQPLFTCFFGCDRTQIIGALRARGLYDGQPDPNYDPEIARQKAIEQQRREEQRQRRERTRAGRIMHQTASAPGTIVEHYLRSRGYPGRIPTTLRFHPGLRYRVDPDEKNSPILIVRGMVCPIFIEKPDGGTARFIGIHRTYLAPDGADKAAVERPREIMGQYFGGAVRLAAPRGILAVSEGIETGLSFQFASGIPTWAALNTGGIVGLRLPRLELAPRIVIAADNDEHGAGLQAAERARDRFVDEGRQVTIVMPDKPGWDFNDVLRKVGPSAIRALLP